MSRPRVTVLMAVYNVERFVEDTIRSVLGQTFEDFEFLIMNDGSTDRTPAILDRCAADDRRIRVQHLPQNVRPPRALNQGLDLAEGTYVARVDGDDLCAPERLARQVDFLDRHPEVVLIGASVHHIDVDGRLIGTRYRPRDDFAVRWLSRFNMPLVNPTSMYRRAPDGGFFVRYNTTCRTSEDYRFTANMLAHGQVVNLPDVLLSYRVHGSSITGTSWNIQQQEAKATATEYGQVALPATIYDGLAAFRAGYYDGEAVPVAEVLAGLKRMLRADIAAAPDRAPWLRRQTAQMAFHVMQRMRLTRADKIRAFLGPGLGLLPGGVMRALELKRALPDALRSDPRII